MEKYQTRIFGGLGGCACVCRTQSVKITQVGPKSGEGFVDYQRVTGLASRVLGGSGQRRLAKKLTSSHIMNELSLFYTSGGCLLEDTVSDTAEGRTWLRARIAELRARCVTAFVCKRGITETVFRANPAKTAHMEKDIFGLDSAVAVTNKTNNIHI